MRSPWAADLTAAGRRALPTVVPLIPALTLTAGEGSEALSGRPGVSWSRIV